MPIYESLPKRIHIEIFEPDQEPWPVNVQEHEGGYAVYNGLHDSLIKIQPGSGVRVDNPEDTYPIDADYLEKNYRLVEEGKGA